MLTPGAAELFGAQAPYLFLRHLNPDICQVTAVVRTALLPADHRYAVFKQRGRIFGTLFILLCQSQSDAALQMGYHLTGSVR